LVDIPIPRRPRFAVIDVARGVAIVAMALFHFTWDLGPDFFGFISVNAVTNPALIVAARLIAGSFLFIVGISLVLAHRGGFRSRAYFRRLAIIIGAAALVTVATRLAVPDAYVRFGILHGIAAASLIGLAFLRAPIWAVLLAAVAAFAAPLLLVGQAFNGAALLWLGLGSYLPAMIDYVPVLPWVGPTLIGIAATRWALANGLDQRFGQWQPTSAIARGLALAGRWSLPIYLIHQPILIGLIYLASLAIGRPTPTMF
jgi:uncharacterized membrane protein